MEQIIDLAVCGAAGRMGRRVIALAATDPTFRLVAALEAPAHPTLGEDAGVVAGAKPLELPITSSLPVNSSPRVMIDFSHPEGTATIVETCLSRRIALVSATTGLSAEVMSRLRAATSEIPVLWSPNMSLMVNLTMKLVQSAAKALAGKDVDVEIIERHHRFKEDAPSGTALKLGEIIAQAMGQTRQAHGRQGRPGARPRDEIGYHAVRAGDDPGQHTVLFAMLGELIELTVRVSSRDAYALGALAAAKFLVNKPAGFYSMADVLGL
ncbi:MAG: 4-hydroxy-tetrahydrodipicolinate reductase [Thermoguttaceae bacterium]|nr:4-hydroxy-tetrahydrodipicolinate reductase [Thermoguttaceae bacterium]MDW8078548.1 4-hydroxy-tetrahydrodipicolinate reductase [Thermoguttaceae bacterium]